ncbi:MAG: DUF7507 domain-containing protein, partial [bacterium]
KIAEEQSLSHTGGQVPKKDDLSNNYFLETVVNGETFFEIGTERLDVNGSSEFSAELNQTTRVCQADGSGFTSTVRQDGDLLVDTTVEGGGVSACVRVFVYDEIAQAPNEGPDCGATGTDPDDCGFTDATGGCWDILVPAQLFFFGAGAKNCVPGPAPAPSAPVPGDVFPIGAPDGISDVCATHNYDGDSGSGGFAGNTELHDDEIQAGPWGAIACEKVTTDTSRGCHARTHIPGRGLFEAQLNVSALFGGAGDPCLQFGSTTYHSRSSHSLTATAKDTAGIAALAPICGIEVTKTGDTLGKIGDPVDYTITVHNTGDVTLYKQSIIDDVLGDLTDGTNVLITATTCGASLAPDDGAAGGPDECTINASRTVQAGDPDPLPNTVTVVYD